jgi:1-deoxy-D-xylulose-5-phosphate synthase
MSARHLRLLAEEIREELVRVVLRNGGHLAANLGVVELTLALHLCFDTSRDRIVWDVGHQCYVHKLLTGRRSDFAGLRQQGGLSGFPSPRESPHDAFGTGHGSTSISAALGLARARDLRGENHQVVAVIGDGAMSGGLAFEGLNQAGTLKSRLIVVLNDNAMSISPNVGALSHYLQRVRTDPHYLRLKRDFEAAMHRLPLGDRLLEKVNRFKDGVKYMLTPGVFFEQLGLKYLGPVDGHDMKALRVNLELAKRFGEPVLVHVITKKGKGFAPAEENATLFHGVTGTNSTAEKAGRTYTEVFGEAMISLAEREPRLVAVTAAMEEGTGLGTFAERFPQRFFDVGMAEGHAATFAAGLAMAGMRPVVAIYSTFLQRAYDQILHDVCIQGLPVVFAVDRAGVVAHDGPTHQGLFDLSYLRQMPNMVVMAPADGEQLPRMLVTALSLGSPAALRYPKALSRVKPIPGEFEGIPVGEGRTMRDGEDLFLVGIGSVVASCLDAAEVLHQEGIEAGVIDARFVKPLDVALLARAAKQTGLLVTVEENVLPGGFGSAVREALANGSARRPSDQNGNEPPFSIHCLGVESPSLENGDRETLLRQVGLDVKGIARFAEAALRDKRQRVAV